MLKSLVIRGVEIKTIVRCQYTSIRMASEKGERKKRWWFQNDEDNRATVTLTCGWQEWTCTSTMENSSLNCFLCKVKQLTACTSNSSPGYLPKRN